MYMCVCGVCVSPVEIDHFVSAAPANLKRISSYQTISFIIRQATEVHTLALYILW